MQWYNISEFYNVHLYQSTNFLNAYLMTFDHVFCRRAKALKDNVKPCLHDTTGCQSGWTTVLTTGWTTGCIVFTNIQPVVEPVVQPVCQLVVSCKRGISTIWFIRCLRCLISGYERLQSACCTGRTVSSVALNDLNWTALLASCSTHGPVIITVDWRCRRAISTLPTRLRGTSTDFLLTLTSASARSISHHTGSRP